jgi:hypothetical protein
MRGKKIASPWSTKAMEVKTMPVILGNTTNECSV